MERREETKAVKAALKKAGYADAKVQHGRGTAWGWMDVHFTMKHSVDCTCAKHSWGTMEAGDPCRAVWNSEHDAILRVVQETTGRSGDYHGRINVHLDFDNEQYE